METATIYDFERLNSATVKTPPLLDSRRRGILTGSMISPIMAIPKGKFEIFTGAAETYLLNLAVARITGKMPERFETPAMRLGIEREPEAIAAFEAESGYTVAKSGQKQQFNIHESGLFGSTPDGVINGFGIPVEAKCPGYQNHLQYRSIRSAEDLQRISPAYYWQCVTHAACLKQSHCWFISYNPEAQVQFAHYNLHRVLIQIPDADVSRLIERAELAEAYIRKIVESGEV